MAIPNTQQVTAQIAPSDLTDIYATHDAFFGKGGRREVANNSERDAIPVARRTVGMIVFVEQSGLEWKLDADLVSWLPYVPNQSYVLDRANHTGTQAMSTITGLAAALAALGDMKKAVYDINNNNIVDDSDKLGGQSPNFYTNRANHTGSIDQSDVLNLITDLGLKEDIANKGVSGGYVPLDGSGLIDVSYLPFIIAPGYKGLYDASTNTPAILNGGGGAVVGDFYIANVLGNAYAPVNVTIMNQIVAYNGTIWQAGGAFAGVASVNGYVGPAVTLTLNDIANTATRFALTASLYNSLLNSTTALTAGNPVVSTADMNIAIAAINATISALTADNIAESATRFYLTANWRAALLAATAPSGSNKLITQTDLTAAITVGNTFFTPELFADGKTTGNEQLRTLASLGYNNTTANNTWPRTGASAFPLDVNACTIDDAIWQEAMYTMRDTGQHSIITPGNKAYCFKRGVLLPKDQLASSIYRRSRKFIIDFNTASFPNRSGVPIIMFDRYFSNQSELIATPALLDQGYIFLNGTASGNGSTNINDCFIRLGATTHSVFKNIETGSFGCGLNLQFVLELTMENIKHGGYKIYGTKIGYGEWTGGTNSSAGVNGVNIITHRTVNTNGNSPIAGLYFHGGGGNMEATNVLCEGYSGSVHHIFYDQSDPANSSSAETGLVLNNLYFETAGASRAAIKFQSNKGFFAVNRWSNIVSNANMPVLVEAMSPPGFGAVAKLYVQLRNTPTTGITNKLRGVSTYSVVNHETGYGPYWDIKGVSLPDNTLLRSAANFDLSDPTYVWPIENTPNQFDRYKYERNWY